MTTIKEKKETWIIKSHISVKGVNDMLIAQVVLGYLVLASFHGNNCYRNAKSWKRKYDAGLTPNNRYPPTKQSCSFTHL